MRTHTKHIGVHTDTREQSNVRQFLFTTFTTKGERLYHPHFFRKREKVLLLHHPEYKASKQAQHSISRPDATKTKAFFEINDHHGTICNAKTHTTLLYLSNRSLFHDLVGVTDEISECVSRATIFC